MKSNNNVTLEAYEHNFNEFISTSSTPLSEAVAHKEFIEKSLALLPSKDASILEIGAAHGRDSLFMKSLGYENTTSTDAIEVAVDYMRNRGLRAEKFNILTDELQDYDLIYAAAVFLHFNEDEFDMILHKIYNSLPEDGVLAFSVKDGEGEQWHSGKLAAPRYFKYWNEVSLRRKLEQHQFRVVYLQLASPFPATNSTTKRNTDWLYVICQKVRTFGPFEREKA